LKVSKHSPIKILGGGIAGLTAGIFLKQAGYDPIIYEKNIQCGAGRHGDIEGLETWNFNANPIEFLNQLNIPLDFHYRAETHFKIILSNFHQFKFLALPHFSIFSSVGIQRVILTENCRL